MGLESVVDPLTRKWIDQSGRLTYQATKSNKVNYSYEGNGARPGTGRNGNCSGANPLTTSSACSTLYPLYAYQTSVKWTSASGMRRERRDGFDFDAPT